MRDLLVAGHRLAVIVRDSKKQSAQTRIESVLQYWERELGQSLPRPIVFTGDVSLPDLGLDHEAKAWIGKYCDRVLHNAAVLQFAGTGRDSEPWITNLGGTKHVLDLCRDVNITEFHYVSSAYVCGDRSERVLENELDSGQKFRNDYEESKFLAEKLVRESDFLESTTIYRPAVISGDSETGFTNTYHGLFLYLRLLSMLVPEQQDQNGAKLTKISLPYSGDEPRNVVPVNWVSQVICRIIADDGAHGETYHLAPDQYVTARQVVDCCYGYFGSAGVEYAGAPSGDEPPTPESEFAAKFFENTEIYSSYDSTDPKFDCTNLKQVAGDLPCPPIDNDVILRYLEFGRKDNWGKRRKEKPVDGNLTEDHINHVATAATHFAHLISTPADNGQIHFGVNVIGIGGGQWSFKGSPKNGFVFERGLPSVTHRVLTCTAETLERLTSASSEQLRNDSIMEFVAKATLADTTVA